MTIAHFYLYQVRKTEHNFLLINLIASELAIALTLSLDFWGSVTRGENFENYPFLCPISGFAHTFFGKQKFFNIKGLLDQNGKYQPHYSCYIIFFEGLNSLFTVVSMAGVRYSSVVRLERFWHSQTRSNFWSSPYILKLWGIALLFAIPPMVGFGEYKLDASEIWYVTLTVKISFS